MKIRQLIPADCWTAWYLNPAYKDDRTKDPLIGRVLVAWALIEDEGVSSMVGMEVHDGHICPTEEEGDMFFAYARNTGIGQMSSEKYEEAKELAASLAAEGK